jgi:hypothetical protein
VLGFTARFPRVRDANISGGLVTQTNGGASRREFLRGAGTAVAGLAMGRYPIPGTPLAGEDTPKRMRRIVAILK